MLVSVISSTFQRHDLLMNRCLPSVMAQTYPQVEHVIVSDVPDPVLALRVSGYPHVRYIERPGPPAPWGALAKLAGTQASSGELLAYCDDDNALRPDHVQVLAEVLMSDPDIGFAYSAIQSHGLNDDRVIGDGKLEHGAIDVMSIMHRREIIDIAAWRYIPGMTNIDWDLVERWLAAGVKWKFVPAVTADYYYR